MTTFRQALHLAQSGDLAGAEKILTHVVRRERKNADAFHLLANILHAKGDITGALTHFAQAAKVAPNDGVIAFNHAAVLAAVSRHAEAAESFSRALMLNPGDKEALFARGASLAAIQRYAEALESYDAARAAGLTDSPQLYANRGAALAALGRHEEALASFERTLAANPNDAETQFNRGAALLELDRSEEAIAALDQAIERNPAHAVAYAVRGVARANLGRFDDALADVDFAIARQPDRIDHIKRRAYVLTCANRRAEALAAFEQVVSAAPDDAEATFGLADAQLTLGDFERGLANYETRFGGGKKMFAPPSDAPLWDGVASLKGKTILVQGEQGFGDLFQFSRFVPELAARGATVILQERAPTLALMQNLTGVSRVISSKEPAPPADYRIPLASLMHAMRMRLESIPAPIPYIAADPARVAAWRDKFGPTSRRRVGICWAGSMGKPLQRARKLDDAALDQILSADAEFVSLQFEAGAEAPILAKHNVRDFGADTKEFAELAALIENLDLIVSVDTNVAHLAGALGKPLWILLPFSADWRWLLDRNDTPWYPQARIYRQQSYGDWSDVAAQVKTALDAPQ